MHPMFMCENRGIASVTSVALRGRPGKGVSVLIVRVDAITQPLPVVPTPPPPRIVTIGGRVISVAPLAPQHVFWQCVEHAQSQSVELEAFLSNAQVRALDQARSARGDFELNVSLEAQVFARNGLTGTSIDLPAKVTASDWSRLLSEWEFEDRATIDVPVEGGRVGPPLDKAAAFVKAALDRVEHRQWADALTQCREALDELQRVQQTPAPTWGDWADKTKREAWGIVDRLVAAQAAVRHMTHAGPHAAIGNADEHAVRLAVIMTAALLRYYASR
jgi:hypothetical protein